MCAFFCLLGEGYSQHTSDGSSKKIFDFVVRDAHNNKAVEGAIIEVYRDSLLLHSVVTDSYGIARMYLYPGKHHLEINRAGYAGKKLGFTVQTRGVEYYRILLFRLKITP